MTKVYLDTNILIGLFASNHQIHPFCKTIFQLAELGEIKLFCNTTSIINLTYVFRKEPLDKVLDNIRLLRKTITITQAGELEIDRVLNNPWPDLEDAHQHACAISVNAELIATNDKTFALNSTIPALGPKELLKKLVGKEG